MVTLRVIVILSVFLLVAVLFITGCSLIHQARLGSKPQGERLATLKQSPQYADGQFQNVEPTPMLLEGESKLSIIISNIFSSSDNLQPTTTLPNRKVALKDLPVEKDLVIWLGHSSFYVHLGRKRILIDPVLSSYASPFSFMIKAFDGTSVYSVDDLPNIDALLISHDHWDHLDYDTVTAIRSSVETVFVPLGVGAHFESWGFEQQQIREADWYDTLNIGDSLSIHLTPARHYSGRGLSNRKTLWGGFVLESDQQRLLFAGDSGYGVHFKALGEQFGSFDLVALDMGQYDPRWPYIHMTPEQASQAATDLNSKVLLPAHIGRFTLAKHDWREPFEKITELSSHTSYQLATPVIGDVVYLPIKNMTFEPWWREH
ncbi:MBL fold metallo-hydrolase [Vibrio vulnificus]